ncbi:MAG: guanylate kinase [Lachnospiraceae bacterium]|nr:guanylate kinase [Lachnospiraceae bacterium]
MIYYIMGKSASGKDTLYKRLLDAKLDLRTIPIYTTRPKRDGEMEGHEYHFVDERYIEDNAYKVIEKRVYDTVFGPWIYATIDDGSIVDEHNYLMIGTLESYVAVRDYYGKDKVYPIYMEVDDEIRRERALKREREQKTPKYDEMERRFKADKIDFSEEKINAAGIVKRYNANDFDRCVAEIIQDIQK